jgi:hypothetical protein
MWLEVTAVLILAVLWNLIRINLTPCIKFLNDCCNDLDRNFSNVSWSNVEEMVAREVSKKRMQSNLCWDEGQDLPEERNEENASEETVRMIRFDTPAKQTKPVHTTPKQKEIVIGCPGRADEAQKTPILERSIRPRFVVSQYLDSDSDDDLFKNWKKQDAEELGRRKNTSKNFVEKSGRRLPRARPPARPNESEGRGLNYFKTPSPIPRLPQVPCERLEVRAEKELRATPETGLLLKAKGRHTLY